jgi:hypothetical protein
MKRLVWLLLVVAVTGLTILTGCTSSSFFPSISSFAANPVSTGPGGTVSLTGIFTNGTGVVTPGNIGLRAGLL